MVKAWYMDDSTEDPRLEHHLDPPKFVSREEIPDLTRVEIYRIWVDDIESDESYGRLKRSSGYNYEDICEISEKALGSQYDEKIKMFYTEHLHDDDEVRLFLAGSGYFDVRDCFDKWIRIKAEKGDLLILPAGLYHRFTPDMQNYAKVRRLFSGKPVWTAINRPTDEEEEKRQNERKSRKSHLSMLGKNSLEMMTDEIFVKKES